METQITAIQQQVIDKVKTTDFYKRYIDALFTDPDNENIIFFTHKTIYPQEALDICEMELDSYNTFGTTYMLMDTETADILIGGIEQKEEEDMKQISNYTLEFKNAVELFKQTLFYKTYIDSLYISPDDDYIIFFEAKGLYPFEALEECNDSFGNDFRYSLEDKALTDSCIELHKLQ